MSCLYPTDDEQWQQGYDEGYGHGSTHGHQDGHADQSYSARRHVAKTVCEDSFEEGYEHGYEAGYKDGYQHGFELLGSHARTEQARNKEETGGSVGRLVQIRSKQQKPFPRRSTRPVDLIGESPAARVPVHLVENSVTTENGILVASVSAITDGKLDFEERILGNQILTEISDDDYLDRLLARGAWGRCNSTN